MIDNGYSVRNGGKRQKSVLTTEGELIFRRTILRTQKKSENETNVINKKEFIAFDDFFRLSNLPFKMTKNSMNRIVFWAQNQGSYKQAQTTMREELGIYVSDEYIRNITMYVGKLVYDHDTEQSRNIERIMDKIPERPSKEGVLYAMMDGSMLNTLEEFDERYDWHEVKLGLVFSDNHLKQDGKSERHIITKKEFTVCTKNIEEFRKYFFDLAVRNGYGKYKRMIILGDGAAWISKIHDDFFPDAIQILDFFHVAENIYNAAKFLFSNDEKKYVPWAKNIIALLKSSRTKEALKILSEYKDMKFGEGVLNPYTYIYNHRGKIDYAAYERSGYMIGSGPIESANKVVVQKRCKQSGMRWKSMNVQKMLSLRAKWESGLWKSTVQALLASA